MSKTIFFGLTGKAIPGACADISVVVPEMIQQHIYIFFFGFLDLLLAL
jgi:hypothetical protein